MGMITTYECDVTGEKDLKEDDVIIFTVRNGGNETTVVVKEDVVTEAIESDGEELLSKIVFRD